MRTRNSVTVMVAVGALLVGCAAQPIGPTIAVMPSPNKPFEVFEQDQAACRDYAQFQVQGQPEAANQTVFGSAVVGTVLGAGLGAAIGGGQGAAIGAASGAVVGTGVGSGGAGRYRGSIQYQYDSAFAQCMHAKGDQVPGARPIAYAPPPPPGAPPPGTQPPPPVVSSQPLAAGSSSMGPSIGQPNLILAIQVELRRLGLLEVADGNFGPRTRSAISTYQRVRGLPVDGLPTAALYDSLKAT